MWEKKDLGSIENFIEIEYKESLIQMGQFVDKLITYNRQGLKFKTLEHLYLKINGGP